MDLPPREHPLAEIQKLVVQLELLEDLLGIRPEPLHTFDPVIRPLRLSSMRYPLDIGVVVETELRPGELPPIPIVNGTTRQLHVLLRNKPSPPSDRRAKSGPFHPSRVTPTAS